MAEAYLSARNGPLAGQRLPLTKAATVIGRAGDSDIIVTNAHVSKEHARIRRDGDDYFIEDLRSRNNTYRNGLQVATNPVRLRDGDRINVARVCDFVFRRPAAQEPVPDAVYLEDDATDAPLTSDLEREAGSSSATIPLTSNPEAKLAAMIEISRHLGSTLALDKMLPQILDSLFEIFLQADRGFVILRADDGRLDARWRKTRLPEDAATSGISRKLVRRVMDSKQAILWRDARTEPDSSQTVAMSGMRSVICAPLLHSAGDALGVLQLDTVDQRKSFKQTDLDVLASVAVQTGIAIENARFHEWAICQERIEQDLELAHQVQRSFLPRARPILAGYDFYDYYRPVHQVGGDYYDYIALPDGRLAVIVADVAGKGVAAALLMARVSAEAKVCLATESRLGSAMTRLNDRLCALDIEQFVTILLAVLDPAKHEVAILNAGHMPPIWRRVEGTIEEPGADSSGIPVGIEGCQEYLERTIQLRPGESLTMYTDGIHEAMDANGEQFTMERIRGHVRRATGGLEDLGQAIIQDLQAFVGTGPRTDDMCLVCLRRT